MESFMITSSQKSNPYKHNDLIATYFEINGVHLQKIPVSRQSILGQGCIIFAGLDMSLFL